MAYGYAPDTLSCDLAISCRKPCREVWQRLIELQRHRSTSNRPQRPKQDPPRQRFEFRASSHLMMPAGIQAHAAPTTARASEINPIVILSVDATEVAEHVRESGKAAHALKSLKVGMCVEPRSVLVSEHTSSAIPMFVYRAKREASQRVNHPYVPNSYPLQSMRGKSKPTEVRESQWGLGLFVSEPCESGDFIGEYVGEMICEPTVLSRGFASTHLKRSYVFGLNPTFSLDSSRVGNETRYMNHSEDPNCSTIVLRVNGMHRIGVFAARAIAEGEELFINYGRGFWETTLANSMADDETTATDVPTPIPIHNDTEEDSMYTDSGSTGTSNTYSS
ncbi:hypothetical protein D9613_008894 [Agrocybe pediades]|uniref:SET domain-containing protein n=1 Tax=Agrocybe pediades TaxID=84607 RepID=A0A8H4VNM3_9AGAR|nr:hypothetical protein D9613_008894 [Agrocybe pediades]